MKARELIVLAAEFVGEELLEHVNGYFDYGESLGEMPVVELLSSFNGVQEELASKYIPLITEEEIETVTGAVPYTVLSKRVSRIVRVTNEWGMSVRFDLYDEYFKTCVGRLKVKYTYLPNEKDTEDEVEFDLYVTKRLIAYGMAADYCLKKGLYDEAEMWDKKYKTAIRDAYKKAPCKRIPAREWK